MACCPTDNANCTPAIINYTVGQTGTVWDSVYMVPLASVTVSAPTFSASDANSDTPQYGDFATFTVTVTDIAPSTTPSPDTISPSDGDFYVLLSNGQRYGTGIQQGVQSGNSINAVGPNQLGSNSVGGTITLSPGQSTTGTVVIDMQGQSGQLFYSGGGQIDGAWSF
jgi:hypothetical protein